MSVTQPAANLNYTTSNTNPTTAANDKNYDQIFDDDVQRFEATEYKQRYGERWKKLATSVRDVVQPDGTIIREYVIEDPSLLEQLSEDEENVSTIDTNIKSNSIQTNPNTIKNNSNNLTNNVKNTSSFKLYSQNKTNTNDKGDKYFQPINKKDEDEVDKEVEIIHEQGEQLKKYISNKDLTQQSVEYEIVDENGNQILINGAEQLKSLAAQVNEVVQPDGSIVKEYVLNDPQIIEQIRNRLKSEANPISTINNNNQQQIASNLALPVKEEPSQIPLNTQSNVIKPQPVPQAPPPIQPAFNFDSLSTTNATITSMLHESNKPHHYHQQQQQLIQQASQPLQPQIKTNKIGVPNISETILYKKDKPAKQEEFINAWCTSNDAVKIKPSSPPSLPFLTQIQHQIQKLQKKTSLNSNDNNITPTATNINNNSNNVKPINSSTNDSNQIQNKIASQLSDRYLAEIDYQTNSCTKKKVNEQSSCQITSNQQLVKKNGKNIFQLKTKRGKALQFTITSDDPTESDIEEVKYIINKSIENLADSYEFEDKNSFSRNKQSTQSAQNFSDNYSKSSSFQPMSNNTTSTATNSGHETSTCSINSASNSSAPQKSGSIGCFKTNEPKNFLNSNNSQIKHYPNMNPVNNSTKIYHVDQTHDTQAKDEKRHSKNLYSSNSGSNENLYAKHHSTSNNQNQYQTHESISATKKHSNSTRFEKNSYLRRSNSFGTNHDSTSSDTDVNYNHNTTTVNTTSNNLKNKSNIKSTGSSSSKKQTIFNGGTYTKSTINFTSQSYDSDFNDLELNNTNKKSNSNKQTKISKSKNSNSNYSNINKSTNNIYDSNLRDVTPEMTEQLLLKLLLQQISQKDYNLQTFKRLNQNCVKDDYSSSSTIYNKNIVSEAASLMMSPVDSSYSSKFNSIKNKLTHKSKNNFEFEVDDDYDQISNQYLNRPYQQQPLPTKNSNSQYMTQQQLLIKKSSQQQPSSSRSKKYTN